MDWKSITLPVALFAFALGAGEPARSDGVKDTSVETPKEIYIECAQRAVSQKLPAGDVARCSEVYEALKLRAFAGDWTLLRQWFQRRVTFETQV